MRTDSRPDKEKAASSGFDEIAFCSTCQTTMTGGLRFCRRCGSRLEFASTKLVETPQHPEDIDPSSTASGGATRALTTALPELSSSNDKDEKYSTINLPMPRPTPNGWDWKEVEAVIPRLRQGTRNLSERFRQRVRESAPLRTRRTVGGVISVLLILAVVGGGWLLWSESEKPAEQAPVQTPASRSYFGTSEFLDVEGGGATFNYVYPPGSPADKAGLIGGDIIVSFDARTVRKAEDLKQFILETPIGKTVQVVYIRDGQEYATKLTTVSKNEMERLDRLHDERPSGKGFMGEGNELTRVFIPELNIYGAQINSIRPNLPADRAGLLNGDIVIELDGTPIRTHKELEIRVERSTPNTVVKVVVIRNGKRLEIPVQLERTY
jgi:hypothetical protein